MEKPEMARLRLVIEGRVQGVFFRASTEKQASLLGLKGWVRNCPDGSVEVVAEGPKEKAEALLTWCRQGPPHAEVSRVRLKWEEFTGEFEEFRVRR